MVVCGFKQKPLKTGFRSRRVQKPPKNQALAGKLQKPPKPRNLPGCGEGLAGPGLVILGYPPPPGPFGARKTRLKACERVGGGFCALKNQPPRALF